MQIYEATQKGSLKMPSVLDPSDVSLIRIYWGAPVFEAHQIYRVGMIVRPDVDNGYYYTCTTSGLADNAPPHWSQSTETTGTVVFAASSYDLWLLPTESITASTWVSSVAGITSNPQYGSGTTSIMVGPIPSTVTDITLTNTVTKSTGEVLNRSLKFKVGEQ